MAQAVFIGPQGTDRHCEKQASTERHSATFHVLPHRRPGKLPCASLEIHAKESSLKHGRHAHQNKNVNQKQATIKKRKKQKVKAEKRYRVHKNVKVFGSQKSLQGEKVWLSRLDSRRSYSFHRKCK